MNLHEAVRQVLEAGHLDLQVGVLRACRHCMESLVGLPGSERAGHLENCPVRIIEVELGRNETE